MPRAEVIDELVGVLVDSTEAIHSGAWATATLEVCLGILASANSGEKSQCRISAAYRRDPPVVRNETELILRHWQDAVPDDRLAHLIRDVARAWSAAYRAGWPHMTSHLATGPFCAYFGTETA